MSNRDPYKLLMSLYKKEKHDELNSLIDNISNITDDDIENTSLRPWIKKALKKHLGDMRIQSLDPYAYAIYNDSPRYIEYSIYKNNTGSSISIHSYDISENDIVMSIDNHTIRINRHICKVENNNILSNLEYIGEMDILKYNELVSKVLEKKYDTIDHDRYDNPLSSVRFQ